MVQAQLLAASLLTIDIYERVWLSGTNNQNLNVRELKGFFSSFIFCWKQFWVGVWVVGLSCVFMVPRSICYCRITEYTPKLICIFTINKLRNRLRSTCIRYLFRNNAPLLCQVIFWFLVNYMFTFVSFEHVSVPIAASNTNRYTAWSVATATEGHITELSGFSLMMFTVKNCVVPFINACFMNYTLTGNISTIFNHSRISRVLVGYVFSWNIHLCALPSFEQSVKLQERGHLWYTSGI